uniref:Uncharacterized protein n=1 Tax=Nelumbo nucifera TaxID=4432 RepID=A0A822Y556_NELNU|nr:TPA_asm: hypothetical protein HUJ06_027824 [Nelumbo nucifera]
MGVIGWPGNEVGTLKSDSAKFHLFFLSSLVSMAIANNSPIKYQTLDPRRGAAGGGPIFKCIHIEYATHFTPPFSHELHSSHKDRIRQSKLLRPFNLQVAGATATQDGLSSASGFVRLNNWELFVQTVLK